jgi:hypothetical protein
MLKLKIVIYGDPYAIKSTNRYHGMGSIVGRHTFNQHKSLITTCPVRPNSNAHLIKTFTLVHHSASVVGRRNAEHRRNAKPLTVSGECNGRPG